MKPTPIDITGACIDGALALVSAVLPWLVVAGCIVGVCAVLVYGGNWLAERRLTRVPVRRAR